MDITRQEFKHCILLSVKGRVDSYTAIDFNKALEEIIDQGNCKIVLDLAGLDFMSSAGLRALLTGQRKCKRYNRGEIILAAVPRRIHEAIELAGFLPLFKTFDETTAAVGSF